MLPRRPTLSLKGRFDKTIHRCFQYPARPWRKHEFLARLPTPKALDRIKLEPGNVVHPKGPLTSSIKGEEHIYPVDLDYEHVTPEDERVGLVLKGLHPHTHVRTVFKYLKRLVGLRHCWVYSEGVCCVRFQDEDAKKTAQSHLKGLESYPFRLYSAENRHWLGEIPQDHPPVEVLPLTPDYIQVPPKESTVLLLRTTLGLSHTTLAPFRRYGMKNKPIQLVYNRFYAHDKWIWEYYILFPSIEDANLAVQNHAGERITVPYSSLSTAEKLKHPYGKTQHLWLRHTGLSKLPRREIQETWLYNMIYNTPRSPEPVPSSKQGSRKGDKTPEH